MIHKIANKTYNGHGLYRDVSVVLPDNTIRLLYKDNVTPSFTKGTATQISQSPNIWDLTYDSGNWGHLLEGHQDLTKVLAANLVTTNYAYGLFKDCTSLEEIKNFKSTNITGMGHLFEGCISLQKVPDLDYSKNTSFASMFHNCCSLQSIPYIDLSNNIGALYYMFQGCSSITSVALLDTSTTNDVRYMFDGCFSLKEVPLFDTSNVTIMAYMLQGCSSLSSIPLFDTSNVARMDWAFNNCYNVGSGSLAIYQQASTQTNPPTGHYQTFRNCGVYSQTGSAELAQIPDDWK